MKSRLTLLSCAAALLFCSLGQLGAAEPKPVESDMHEFMEYVYQPTYKRLKGAMASEPTQNSAWKEIKSTSLILAESGNLLLVRAPEKGADEWNEYSIATRDLGGDLYRAAKKKDYAAAMTSYKAMLQKCNACHTTYAHGEHQLSP